MDDDETMRVLIIANDPLARAGLSALLSTHSLLQVAGQASPLEDAELTLRVFQPDVILWDVGWNFEQTAEAISTAVDGSPPIVVLTGTDAQRAEIWATGVSGVLNRSLNADQIAAALLAVGQGLRVSDGEWVHRLPRPSTQQSDGELEPLTDRELEVLRHMAEGLSNKLIARELMISEHTVKFHVNAILGKMRAQSRTEAVVQATRAGLILL